jgi:hypothetical protein
MNQVEIVKAYYGNLALVGPDKASTGIIADDFRLIAGSIEFDRKNFMAILISLYEAIPDLSHVLSDFQVHGEAVQLTDLPNGTFTSSWDGSSFGLPVIPPSGKEIQMAPIKWEITVRNGKITRLHDVTLPSAKSGLPGFFKALGASIKFDS